MYMAMCVATEAWGHGGMEAAMEACTRQPLVPDTPTQATTGHGRHHLSSPDTTLPTVALGPRRDPKHDPTEPRRACQTALTLLREPASLRGRQETPGLRRPPHEGGPGDPSTATCGMLSSSVVRPARTG